MVNAKYSFLFALVFTIIIFFSGLMFGAFLESRTSDDLKKILLQSEINILDEQMRIKSFDNFDLDCDIAEEGLFDFADRIYYEARTLEEYDRAYKFVDDLNLIHKKYDLLRFLLWNQASELKMKCGFNYKIVVYIYNYNTREVDDISKQRFYSNILFDLKNKHSNEVLLIPIAGDMNLSSLDSVLKDINVSNFPAIIVDNDEIIYDFPTFNELENIVFESNKQ